MEFRFAQNSGPLCCSSIILLTFCFLVYYLLLITWPAFEALYEKQRVSNPKAKYMSKAGHPVLKTSKESLAIRILTRVDTPAFDCLWMKKWNNSVLQTLKFTGKFQGPVHVSLCVYNRISEPGLFVKSTHLITHDPRLRQQQGLCLCFQNDILSSSREHHVSLLGRRGGSGGRGQLLIYLHGAITF